MRLINNEWQARHLLQSARNEPASDEYRAALDRALKGQPGQADADAIFRIAVLELEQPLVLARLLYDSVLCLRDGETDD